MWLTGLTSHGLSPRTSVAMICAPYSSRAIEHSTSSILPHVMCSGVRLQWRGGGYIINNNYYKNQVKIRTAYDNTRQKAYLMMSMPLTLTPLRSSSCKMGMLPSAAARWRAWQSFQPGASSDVPLLQGLIH